MFPERGWGWHWGLPGAAGCWLGPTPRPCPWSVWGPESSQNVPVNFPLGRWCCAWRTLGSPPGWGRSRPTNRSHMRLYIFLTFSRVWHKERKHWLLRADMVGEQPEVSIRGDEGEDPLGLPALKPNTWMETDVIQQPRVLGEGHRDCWVAGKSKYVSIYLIRSFHFHFFSSVFLRHLTQANQSFNNLKFCFQIHQVTCSLT